MKGPGTFNRPVEATESLSAICASGKCIYNNRKANAQWKR